MKTLMISGCGKLASALLLPWLKQDTLDQIVVTVKTREGKQRLLDCFGFKLEKHLSIFVNNRVAIQSFDFSDIHAFFGLILGVKPYLVQNVCEELRETLALLPEPHRLVISLAAKTSLSDLDTYLNAKKNKIALLRVVTNTAAREGIASTVLIGNEVLTSAQKQQVTDLFSVLGNVIWYEKEDNLAALTTLISSSPAFYYALLLAYARAVPVSRCFNDFKVAVQSWEACLQTAGGVVKCREAFFEKALLLCQAEDVHAIQASIQRAFDACRQTYEGLDQSFAEKQIELKAAPLVEYSKSIWFAVIQGFLLATERQGVPKEIIDKLAVHLPFHAVKMVEAEQLRCPSLSLESCLHQLIQQIATKGGMTEAGVRNLL